MILLALLAATAAAPQPGELKTFKDWTVGCDNGRTCQAVALFPEPELAGASLALKRGPEAGAVPQIWFTTRGENGEELKPATIDIDGRLFALGSDADGNPVPRDPAGVAARIGHATRVSLLDARSKVLARISMNGSAAALLYMDEQQRRIGTTSALVRRGPATAVPPSPALPLVQRPPVPRKPARKLATSRIRQLLGREATVCEYAQELSVETARLDARHSLVLASHPCGNGAYNFVSSAFIVDEAGRARPAPFDHGWGRAQERPDHHLYGASWDAESRRLSTFFKGRGIGDCGNGETYAWDGARFRLVEQQVMGECRGSTDYITTWRAEVR